MFDVLIIGGGPAGLGLATALCQQGVGRVRVLEREAQAGGVPRHCGHYPFGWREFGALMKGPDYARKLVEKARAAGVEISTGVAVIALLKGGRLRISQNGKISEIAARRIGLCMGVREASRAQRMISGQRPSGVISTGALQSMVFLHGLRPFLRPVILGSELVSLSAIMTCAHMGIKPVMMLEEAPGMKARAIMRPYPALKGIPMRFGVSKVEIVGDKKVEAVRFSGARGRAQKVAADGVIVSGHFRPEAALLHESHLELDGATGGPVIDQYGRCSDPHYFAAGNLLRPVETAGWCWQEAVEAATRLVQDLKQEAVKRPFIRLKVEGEGLRYVVPQRLSLTPQTGGMRAMQLRMSVPASGYLTALSGGRSLHSAFVQARPERRLLLPLAPILNAKPEETIRLRLL